MVKYSFRQEDYEKWLVDLALQLNIPVHNNIINLPSHLGKGFIVARNISRHLSYAVINAQFEHDLVLEREAGGWKGFYLTFNQVEMKKEIQSEAHPDMVIERKPLKNDILLADTEDPCTLRIPAGSDIKKLMIFYSDEITRQYLPADLYNRLSGFAKENSLSSNKHFINLSHRETLKEMFETRENDPVLPVRKLSQLIQLTEKFLHSFLRQGQSSKQKTVKKNDLESMHHVEQILSRHNLEGFPSLESLAQEVYMSTSKLKNLFKDIYGYTLYDYYNKSRLLRAKEMLVSGQFSIKQAGSEIGFSNLSHFAKAFRKEFGVLPREVVKSR
ncbi:MAG: helix-turn-helix transcriptional regulator [Puia sp.]|nr:helix-turn-helix transcriptional regulator [Puia sp.]